MAGCGSRGACVGWKEARFEPLEMNADALRSIRCFQQYCGHFRRNQWALDDCCSQRGKSCTCSDVSAEPRIGLIRRRSHRYVILFELLILGDGGMRESEGAL